MTATYTVERSRTVDAPAERIFGLLSDFRQWTRWSPWDDLDPDLKRAYGGADEGVGATYAWSGNRKAGAGRMEIVAADPDRHLDISLVFEKPFRSESTTSFELRPDGDRTVVVWRMVGPKPRLMRVLSPVLSMDRLVGKDFERGLASLDRAATSQPPA